MGVCLVGRSGREENQMRPKPNLEIITKHFWEKVDKSDVDGCWIWKGGFGNHGYGTFAVFGKTTTAPRAAFFLETGKFPKNLACHTCDNRKCVRFSHLFDGTYAENNQDMYNKKRYPTKLTEEEVKQIKKLLLEGEGQRPLGRRFGVTQAVIRDIKTGKTWKRV